MKNTRGFRAGIAFLGAAIAISLATPALATSKPNIDLLTKHFASLGTPAHVQFTQLGGPETGAAEVGGKLLVVIVDGKSVRTLIDEPFHSAGNNAGFSFMGDQEHHLLTYNASPFTDSQGRSHVKGDLLIRDVSGATPVKQLFELRDAVDVGFKVDPLGSMKFQDNFIWQPELHFLNTGERLPRRSLYSRLLWDEAAGDYKLGHFLTPMPDAGKVEADNTNNRAILFYRAGHLTESAQLFSQATTQAMTGQSIVAHNNKLVSLEMEDLLRQGRNLPGQPYDEALAQYWCGEYEDALATLALRGDAVTEFDYALRGLALAQERRWAEVDEDTDVLAHKALSASGRGKGFYADYLGELVSIALLQGPKMQQVAGRYMKALEATDANHPALVRAKAALMQRSGHTTETQRMLETYINIAGDDADVADLRLMLFEMYQNTGQPVTTLLADAQRSPLRNIAGYVDLVDYYNMRSALGSVAFQGDMWEIKGALNGISLPDSRPDGDYQGDSGGDEDQPQSGILKGTSK